MSYDFDDNLLPVCREAYTRLFDTEIPHYKIPHVMGALQRMYKGSYTYIMFCGDVHRHNPQPIDRRQMETRLGSVLQAALWALENRERSRAVFGYELKPDGIQSWIEAFETYSMAVKWVDTWAANDYWNSKAQEPGYANLDTSSITVYDEIYDRPPVPDYWLPDGRQMCRAENVPVYDGEADIELWEALEWYDVESGHTGLLKDIAQDEFIEGIVELVREQERKMEEMMSEMGGMSVKGTEGGENVGDEMQTD